MNTPDKNLSRQTSKIISLKDTMKLSSGDTNSSFGNETTENLDFNYRTDIHCEDVLMFSSTVREYLFRFEPVCRGALIFQDKTTSLAVSAMKVIAQDQGDIILVNDVSGLTALHLISVLQPTGFEGRVLICNVFSDELSIRQIQDNLEQFQLNGTI